MKPCRRNDRNLPRMRVLALCLGLLVPPVVMTQTSEPLLDEARQALRDNDVRTASIHLKNLLKKSPSNADARTLQGQMRFAQRDYPGPAKE